MDPVVITVVIKGVGMLLLAGGGILALKYGYSLYRDGTGASEDGVELEFIGAKAKAASIGSVVMATAFAWGALAVYVSPNLDKTGETIRVYSFESQDGEITSRAVATRTPNAGATTNPETMKGLFQQAVKKAGNVVSVNGVPASLDPASVKAWQISDEVQLTADFHAGAKTASMVFTPRVDSGELIFVPSTTAGQTANNEGPPNEYR